MRLFTLSVIAFYVALTAFTHAALARSTAAMTAPSHSVVANR